VAYGFRDQDYFFLKMGLRENPWVKVV